MTAIEARQAVATALQTLSIQAVLEVCEAHAEELMEACDASGDKLARHRAASDHRNLVNTRERLHN